MLDLIQELKQSLRSLIRDRAFTFFSVLALALGLGLNGSILVLSRNFIFKGAPAQNPEQLFEVKDIGNKRLKTESDPQGSPTAYIELRKQKVFSQLAFARMKYKAFWNTPEGVHEIQAIETTHEYLSVLGLKPLIGRYFEAGETGSGASKPQVALVSHRFWKKQLNTKPDVLGSLVNLDGKSYTIIGVMPKGFEGHTLNQGVELFLPWADRTVAEPVEEWRSLGSVLARLQPGMTAQQAKAAMATLDWGKHWHLELQPYKPMPNLLHKKLSRGLSGLHVAALLILGIGLANVLALQTARLQRRRHELALRLALGAKNSQVWRLILLENLLLALLAGCAALILAAAANPLLEALQAILPYPPKVQVSFGLWTALVTLIISLLLGLLLSGFIYLQIRRMDLGSSLKEGRKQTGGIRLRGCLVAIQAALALVLLSSAGLCLKDLRRQLNIPLGMDIQDRYLLECDPEAVGRKHQELIAILPALQDRLGAIPHMRGMAMHTGGPVQGFSTKVIDREKKEYCFLHCSPELPALMQMRLQAGRYPEKGDEEKGRILVSQALADCYWPGESVLGKKLRVIGSEGEVIGLLSNMRFGGPTVEMEPFVVGVASVENEQFGFRALNNLTLHVAGHPKAVKAAIQPIAKAVLKGIPFKLNSLEELRDEKLVQPRQLFFLSAVMGVLALLLSLSGLYGLSAHIAQSRQKEMGLRVVLGATPLKILVELGKGSLLPLVPGLTVGSLLAFGASRWLVSQNEGFPGLSVSVLLMTALILALAAALATLLPAIKAMRQNPAEALRGE